MMPESHATVCVPYAPTISKVFAACALGLFLCGCGKDESLPETYPVTGVVLFDGQPLSESTVAFYPEGEGNPATGWTDAEGRFALTTYELEDGAVAGRHTVIVHHSPSGAEPGMPGRGSGSSVPSKYENRKTTPLTAEVEPKEMNEISLELESSGSKRGAG